jgi:hypothetical protein
MKRKGPKTNRFSKKKFISYQNGEMTDDDDEVKIYKK